MDVFSEGSMFGRYIMIAYLIIDIKVWFMLLDNDNELFVLLKRWLSDVPNSSRKQVNQIIQTFH